MSIVHYAKSVVSDESIDHVCGEGVTCKNLLTRSKGKFNASLSLANSPTPHTVLDADKIACLENIERCDYIFFADEHNKNVMWVVVIEMSDGKGKKATKIASQLQSTAQQVIDHINLAGEAKFLPVFVGSIRETNELRRSKVRYHGKYYPIKILKPNEQLAKFM